MDQNNKDQYDKYVAYLAQNNINQVVYNPDHIHAVEILKNLFDEAKEIVKIYTGAFSGEISSNRIYKAAMERLLDRGIHVQILCQENKLRENPNPDIFDTFRYFSLINPSLIEIKSHPFQVMLNDVEVHFTVADNKMYRVENDIETFQAKCNYNDEKESAIWDDRFDKMFNNPKAKTVYLYKNIDEPISA